jgi:hypothetical protein
LPGHGTGGGAIDGSSLNSAVLLQRASTSRESLRLPNTADHRERHGWHRREQVLTALRQHATPLELTYAFPLPSDGAVSGYEIHAGPRGIRGRAEKAHPAPTVAAAAIIGLQPSQIESPGSPSMTC